MLQKNLTEGQIYNYTVAMISVMLRPLRGIRKANLCDYSFQFHRESEN